MELILPILLIVGFFLSMRAFGAWMFRIDEVVKLLRKVNEKLDKLSNEKKDSS